MATLRERNVSDYLGVEGSKEDNLSVGAKGGAIAFSIKVASAALALLNQIVLARILGANGVGEVLLAISVVKVSTQISKFGMEETLMRFIPVYVDQKDPRRLKGTIYFALKICIVISIIFVFLILLLSKFIAINLFHSTMLLKLLPVIAVAIPAGVIRDVIGGILKGYKDTYKALLPENLISPLFRLAVFLFLTLIGVSSFYAVIAFITGEILSMILSIRFLSQRLAAVRDAKKQCENRRVLKVAYTIILASFSMFLFSQTDILIIGMLKTTQTVGIYGIAAKLVFLGNFPSYAFGTIMPPIFSSAYASGDFDELNRVARKSIRWILSMAIPIILLLVLEGKFVLRYFYGPEFEAGYTVLLVLTAAYLISTSAGIVGLFLQMTGQHKVFMKLNIFFLLLNVILNIILVTFFGMLGAAVATAFCIVMLQFMCAIIIYKRFSIVSLPDGYRFDVYFVIAVSSLYSIFTYAEISIGPHLLLVGALTVYLWKSLKNDDIPWRIFLAKNRKP
jgi:O-antigen/teichoic acid export membrane protein